MNLRKQIVDALGKRGTGFVLRGLMSAIALRARIDPSLRGMLRDWDRSDPLDSLILIRTRDDAVRTWIRLRGNGMAVRGSGGERKEDTVLTYKDREVLLRALFSDPAELLDLILRNDLSFCGDLSAVARFSYFMNVASGRDKAGRPVAPLTALPPPDPRSRRPALKAAGKTDAVKHLEEPYLSAFALEDFPRLRRMRERWFATRPEICVERARLVTEWCRRNGFEADAAGRPHDPVLRQARIFRHLMENRRPAIAAESLLAGTTTSKELGVVIYPECGGVGIWPELRSVSRRRIAPYEISEEDISLLNRDVFPYWSRRNVRETMRARNRNPQCQRLEERFVLYFTWKHQAISHTIPDFPAALSRGLSAIKSEAAERERNESDAGRRNYYLAVQEALAGVIAYSDALAAEAERRAAECRDERRASELREIARVCRKVPAGPAETLHEAVQSVWTCWIAMHMENTNAGLSLGRLDAWWQPYFERDLAKCATAAERDEAIRRAIELAGCFFMRCADHLPMVADIGNKLFAGSSSDQALTLGGVLPDGGNAVADMTYVILKVAEMLAIRDPNLNARFYPGVNSDAYLRRLCEVNVLTASTPSLHNDRAIVAALENQGFAPADSRDWGATGCVEPTSAGRHFGHTNCLMFNMVAPLEMALNDGVHPLLGERVGPRTGDPRVFKTYEEFENAFERQLEHLIRLSVECNNFYGLTHRLAKPTPYLSSLIQGTMEQGMDVTAGGAKYNTSGVAMVGFADVVDSLVAVRSLVFEERATDFASLLDALEKDFAGHDALLARIKYRVSKFGSADPLTSRTARELVEFVYRTFQTQPHYRGGRYLSGFWSMSNHVAFGTMSGALPSGRRRFRPFAPGITPTPASRDDLTTQMRSVCMLPSALMPNNIAFNVKIVPSAADTHAELVDRMSAYVRTYFELGGMQMQFNVVSSETLRDAMAHPENHRSLMVRISGYNAYFTDLNRDMQLELVSRTEHRI